MTDTELWATVVGAAMPFIVAFVAQTGWSRQVNAILGVAVCAVAGAITVWLTDGFDFDGHLVRGVLLTIVAAGALLETFWRPTGMYDWLKERTSPGVASADQGRRL